MSPMQAVNPPWTAIASLRLRLAPQLRFSRQIIRGEVWFILRDPLSGRHFRVTSEAHMVLELFDGSRTLEQVYRLAGDRLAQQMPSQQEVADLVLQLHGSDLLRGMPSRDSRELAVRAAAARRARVMRMLKSPLAIRVPLINPDRFLERMRSIGRVLFSPIGFAAWLLAIGWTTIEAGANWGELTGNVMERVLTADNLPLLTLAFVLSKLVHEFGHGLAVKRWGGEVNEMGITLLVFMPVPYVEASSSATFPSKWQRVAVGAAGMYLELLLAAAAMFVWLHLERGPPAYPGFQYNGCGRRLDRRHKCQSPAAIRRLLHSRRPYRDPQPRAACVPLPGRSGAAPPVRRARAGSRDGRQRRDRLAHRLCHRLLPVPDVRHRHDRLVSGQPILGDRCCVGDLALRNVHRSTVLQGSCIRSRIAQTRRASATSSAGDWLGGIGRWERCCLCCRRLWRRARKVSCGRHPARRLPPRPTASSSR